jgi:hypothetical protein
MQRYISLSNLARTLIRRVHGLRSVLCAWNLILCLLCAPLASSTQAACSGRRFDDAAVHSALDWSVRGNNTADAAASRTTVAGGVAVPYARTMGRLMEIGQTNGMVRASVANTVKATEPNAASAALISAILSLLMDDSEEAQRGGVPNLPNVSAPIIDKFELVASDGGGTYIWNSWGLHQPRITHHADGSIRLIYNVLNESGGDSWKLMKKQGDSGTWTTEASGGKFDDAFLLRDPVSDKAHVITSPNSVRTVYSSPAFAPVTIPGAWYFSNNALRQYSGAGIGTDGTVCFKNYEEVPSPIENSNTEVAYICGKMDGSGTWQWNSKVNRNIGPRYAYDYVFPGVQNGFNGFLATAQRDLHKTAAGWPNAADDYVFDGVRFYKSGYASNAGWLQTEIVPQFPASNAATVAPVQRQYDAYIDSQNHVIVNSFREDPANSTVRGFYVTVSDMNGSVLLNKKWNLPTYGNVRMFESADSALWLLWTNSDAGKTDIFLYPVTVVNSPAYDLQISNFTDLSSVAVPYRMQANVFLAVPRGGNQKNNFIDGMMIACGAIYPSACQGPDKIFYFRIRLPGA